MINKKFICEKCGKEMINIDDDFSIGMECPNCGWGWITTKDNPLMTDRTIYNVTVKSAEATKDNIKIISSILNVNYLEAKNILNSLPKEIFCGKAYEVKKIKDILAKSKIEFEIIPKFVY